MILRTSGWVIVHCNCGHPTCDKYTVEHPKHFGTFYQGCGWNKATAQAIADKLNAKRKDR